MSVEASIFISYSHHSERAIRFIELFPHIIKDYNSANPNGPILKIWTDYSINPGDNWQKEIDDAINKSFVVIIAITQEALDSHYVTYEWSYALGIGRHLIPILVDDKIEASTLHPKLQPIQWGKITNKEMTKKCEELIPILVQKYKELQKNQELQEAQRLTQLLYTSLDYARRQRGVGDMKNALQTLHEAEGHVRQFNAVYGTFPTGVMDDLHYEIGRTYHLLDDDLKAKEHFSEGIKYNKNHAYCLMGLGILARKEADSLNPQQDRLVYNQYLAEALRYFQQIADSQPDIKDYSDQSIWASIGGIYKRMDKLNEAIYNYEKALDHKRSSYPYINIALLHFYLNNLPEMKVNARLAFFFSEAYIRLQPDDAWVHSDKFLAQIMLNEFGDSSYPLPEADDLQIEHVIRVSPKVTLRRVKSVLEELMELHGKYIHSNPNLGAVIAIKTTENLHKRLSSIL